MGRLESIITCKHCRELINVFIVDYALELIGKKAIYHSIYYSSPEEDIKQFMSGLRGGEILVVSFEMIRGFEYPIIIDIAGYIEIASRTSSKLVKIYFNKFLEILSFTDFLAEENHHCQKLMERESRPQFNPNHL